MRVSHASMVWLGTNHIHIFGNGRQFKFLINPHHTNHGGAAISTASTLFGAALEKAVKELNEPKDPTERFMIFIHVH